MKSRISTFILFCSFILLGNNFALFGQVEPVGTIPLAMRNASNGKTLLAGSIYIDKDDNFVGARFVSLGAVDGLNSINYIPSDGWTNRISAIPGTGIVANVGSTYYRIYVVSEIVGAQSKGVIGYNIRYQSPFKVSNAQSGISASSLVFRSYGGEQKLYYKSQDINLKDIYDSSDWLSMTGHKSDTPEWNGYFLIKAEANTSTSPRYGTITINDKVSEKSYKVKVTQEAADGFLSVYEDKKDVSFVRQTTNIRIGTNLPFKISSDSEWIRTSYSSANIDIEENKTAQPRQGKVFIEGLDEKKTYTVVINQQVAPLKMTHTEFSIDRRNFTLKSTLKTNAKSWSAKSNVEWLANSFTEKELTIRVSPNTSQQNRTGIVTVTLDNGASIDITVNQGRYKAGDFYNEDGIKGIVFETNGLHGKIFSLKQGVNMPVSMEYVRLGLNDFEDGEKNMAIVKKVDNWSKLYPAFYWCDTYGAPEGNSGWYVPSLNEMESIWKKRNLYNETLKEIKDADIITDVLSGKRALRNILGKELHSGRYKKTSRLEMIYATSTEYDREKKHLYGENLQSASHKSLEKNGGRAFVYGFLIYKNAVVFPKHGGYQPQIVRAVRKF